MEKSPLKFPLQEPEVCPLCHCRTVQFPLAGGSYCSRVGCQWDSEREVEKLPELKREEE